jgi:hypothetical protein
LLITIQDILLSPREERQRVLLREYGFQCFCTVCNLQGAELEVSDQRRRRYCALDSQVRSALKSDQHEQALSLAEQKFKLLSEMQRVEMLCVAAFMWDCCHQGLIAAVSGKFQDASKTWCERVLPLVRKLRAEDSIVHMFETAMKMSEDTKIKDRSCCILCNKKDSMLQACPRCQTTLYCSNECQKKDWPKHKLVSSQQHGTCWEDAQWRLTFILSFAALGCCQTCSALSSSTAAAASTGTSLSAQSHSAACDSDSSYSSSSSCAFAPAAASLSDSVAAPSLPALFHPSAGAGYRIAHLPGKGRGLVATRAFKACEEIMADKPLIRGHDSGMCTMGEMRNKVSALSPAQQQAFYALKCYGRGYPDRETDICMTNSIAGAGVLLRGSLFNHSCANNINYEWSEKEQTMHFFALSDIQVGEELTVDYLGDIQLGSRVQRNMRLSRCYGFLCSCPVCSLTGAALEKSDRRRQLLKQLKKQLISLTELKQHQQFTRVADQFYLLLEEVQKDEQLDVAIQKADCCKTGFSVSMDLGDVSQMKRWHKRAQQCHQHLFGKRRVHYNGEVETQEKLLAYCRHGVSPQQLNAMAAAFEQHMPQFNPADGPVTFTTFNPTTEAQKRALDAIFTQPGTLSFEFPMIDVPNGLSQGKAMGKGN